MNSSEFWSIIGSTVRNISAVIIAFGIIWGASWYALQPRIDDYFNAVFQQKLEAVGTELKTITGQLTSLQKGMPEPRPFVEIRGGRLVTQTSYRAGTSITPLYLVRQNSDCPAILRVQFFSAALNGIAAEYSYDTAAQQVAPSFGFQLFTTRIRLPSDMRPGFYSYAPVMIPDRAVCPTERNLPLEPSPFFEVVER